jgi:eukaryotic-like serine/threonine-protein kinase
LLLPLFVLESHWGYNKFMTTRAKHPTLLETMMTRITLIEAVNVTPHIRLERARWRGQEVLVKRLKTASLRNPAIVERFEREGDVLERLDHPNIPKAVYRRKGVLMREYIQGRTLYHHLQYGAMPREVVVHVARSLLAALSHAHNREVLHLDIKPGNILLEIGGRVQLIDFGCAKDLTLESITHADARLGTPHYMAPEQFNGIREDHRSDIYSVGAVMYECLTGTQPFENDPFVWLTGRAVPPPMPRTPGLSAVVETAMQRDPEDRYQSALEMLEAIEHAG